MKCYTRRCDSLVHYGVALDHASVVRQRIGPLTRHYWRRQGHITVEDLCTSVYIQGLLDGQQLVPHTKEQP